MRDWEQRAAQGERLAADLGQSDVDEHLLTLLLDPADSAVIRRTALALMRRDDLRGARLVLSAIALADSRGDLDARLDLFDAALEARHEEEQRERGRLRANLDELAGDEEDSAVAHAARELRDWLWD